MVPDDEGYSLFIAAYGNSWVIEIAKRASPR